MLIDFANDFADLLVPWTGTRASAGSDDAQGRYVEGASSALSFDATPVQPLTQNELRQQEGGEYVGSRVKTYSPFALLNNDIITGDGVTYQVMQIDNRAQLGTYTKAFLIKVQNDV